MHLCAHNWMRPEPLEHSLRRLSSLGYTSIELAGEPDWYPVEETRALLQKYNIRCWGTVTIQYGTRDLTAADPAQRRATVQYMKDVVALSAALGGEITTVVPDLGLHVVPVVALLLDLFLLSPPWTIRGRESLALGAGMMFAYWAWLEYCFSQNGW